MDSILGNIGTVGTVVAVDKESIDYIGKILVGVVAFGFLAFFLVKKYGK